MKDEAQFSVYHMINSAFITFLKQKILEFQFLELFASHQLLVTSRQSLVASYQSIVTSYQLLVTSYQLLVTSHQSLVTSYQLLVISHQLLVTIASSQQLLVNQSIVDSHQSIGNQLLVRSHQLPAFDLKNLNSQSNYYISKKTLKYYFDITR